MDIGGISATLEVSIGDGLDQLTSFVSKMNDAASSADDFKGSADKLTDSMSGIESAVKDVSDAMSGVGSAAKTASDGISTMDGAVGSASTSIGDAVGNLNAFTDAMNPANSAASNAKDAIGGLADGMLTLGDNSTNAASGLNSVSDAGKSVTDNTLNAWLDEAVKSLGDFDGGTDAARAALKQLVDEGVAPMQAIIKLMSDDTTAASGEIKGFGSDIEAVGSQAGAAATQLGLFNEDVQVPYGDAAGQLNLFTTELEPIGATANGAADGVSNLGDAVEGAKDKVNDGKTAVNDFSQAAQDLLAKQKDADSEWENSKSVLAEIKTAYDDGTASLGALARATDDAQKAFANAHPEIASTKTDVDDLSNNGIGPLIGKFVELGEVLAVGELLNEFGLEALAAADNITHADIALTAITGDGEKAKETIEGLEELGIKDGLAMPGLLTAATRMQNLLGPGADVNEILGKIADGAAVMNTNIGTAATSFDRMASNGTANARTLSNIGLTINDLAKALGVTSDEALKAFKAVGDGMPAAEQTAARVDILNQSLDRLSGTAEKVASSTFSGESTRLADEWDQVLVSIGKDIMPVVTGLMDIVATDILPFIKGAADIFGSLPAPIKDTIVVLGLAEIAIVGVEAAWTKVSAVMEIIGVKAAETSAAEATLAAANDTLALSAEGATIEEGKLAVAEEEVGAAGKVAAGGGIAAFGGSIAGLGLPALATAFGAVALNAGGSAKAIADFINTAGVNVKDVLLGWVAGLDSATVGFKSAVDSVALLNAETAKTAEKTKPAADALANMDAGVRAVSESSADLKAKLIDAQTTLGILKTAYDTGTTTGNGYKVTQLDVAIATDNVTKAQKALEGALDTNTPALKAHADMIKKLGDENLPAAISAEQKWVDSLVASGKPLSQVSDAVDTQDKMIKKLAEESIPAAVTAQGAWIDHLNAIGAPAGTVLKAYQDMETILKKLAGEDLQAAITAQEAWTAHLVATGAPSEVVRASYQAQSDDIKKLAAEDLPLGIAAYQQFTDDLIAMGAPSDVVVANLKAQQDAIKKLGAEDLPSAIDEQADFINSLKDMDVPAGVVLAAYQAQSDNLKKLAEDDLPAAIDKQGKLADEMRDAEEPAKNIRDAYDAQEASIKKLATDSLPKAIDLQQQFIDHLKATNAPASEVSDAYTTMEGFVKKLAEEDLPKAVDLQQQVVDKMIATSAPAKDVSDAYKLQQGFLKQLATEDLPGAIDRQAAFVDQLINTKQPAKDVADALSAEQGMIKSLANQDLPAGIQAQKNYIDQLIAEGKPLGDVIAAQKTEQGMINELATRDLPAAIKAQQNNIQALKDSGAQAGILQAAQKTLDDMYVKMGTTDLPAATKAIGDSTQALIDQGKNWTQVSDKAGQYESMIVNLAKTDLPDAIKMQQDYIDKLKLVGAPQADIIAAQQKMDDWEIQLAKDRGDSTSKYVIDLDNIKQKLQDQQDSYKNLGGALYTDFIKVWNDGFTQLGQSLADNIVAGKSWADTWHSFLQGIEKEIMEQLIGTVFKALRSEIDTLVGKLVGSLSGALTSVGGGVSSLSDAALGTTSSLGKLSGSLNPLSGIVGDFGKNAGDAGSAAAGMASSTSKAAGGMASSASSFMGTLSGIGSAVSAVTGVIGLFQNAAMEATNKLIEQNTRISAIVESKELPLANALSVEQENTFHDISTFTSVLPDISAHTANLADAMTQIVASLGNWGGLFDRLDGIYTAVGATPGAKGAAVSSGTSTEQAMLADLDAIKSELASGMSMSASQSQAIKDAQTKYDADVVTASNAQKAADAAKEAADELRFKAVFGGSQQALADADKNAAMLQAQADKAALQVKTDMAALTAATAGLRTAAETTAANTSDISTTTQQQARDANVNQKTVISTQKDIHTEVKRGADLSQQTATSTDAVVTAVQQSETGRQQSEAARSRDSSNLISTLQDQIGKLQLQLQNDTAAMQEAQATGNAGLVYTYQTAMNADINKLNQLNNQVASLQSAGTQTAENTRSTASSVSLYQQQIQKLQDEINDDIGRLVSAQQVGDNDLADSYQKAIATDVDSINQLKSKVVELQTGVTQTATNTGNSVDLQGQYNQMIQKLQDEIAADTIRMTEAQKLGDTELAQGYKDAIASDVDEIKILQTRVDDLKGADAEQVQQYIAQIAKLQDEIKTDTTAMAEAQSLGDTELAQGYKDAIAVDVDQIKVVQGKLDALQGTTANVGDTVVRGTQQSTETLRTTLNALKEQQAALDQAANAAMASGLTSLADTYKAQSIAIGTQIASLQDAGNQTSRNSGLIAGSTQSTSDSAKDIAGSSRSIAGDTAHTRSSGDTTASNTEKTAGNTGTMADDSVHIRTATEGTVANTNRISTLVEGTKDDTKQVREASTATAAHTDRISTLTQTTVDNTQATVTQTARSADNTKTAADNSQAVKDATVAQTSVIKSTDDTLITIEEGTHHLSDILSVANQQLIPLGAARIDLDDIDQILKGVNFGAFSFLPSLDLLKTISETLSKFESEYLNFASSSADIEKGVRDDIGKIQTSTARVRDDTIQIEQHGRDTVQGVQDVNTSVKDGTRQATQERQGIKEQEQTNHREVMDQLAPIHVQTQRAADMIVNLDSTTKSGLENVGTEVKNVGARVDNVGTKTDGVGTKVDGARSAITASTDRTTSAVTGLGTAISTAVATAANEIKRSADATTSQVMATGRDILSGATTGASTIVEGVKAAGDAGATATKEGADQVTQAVVGSNAALATVLSAPKATIGAATGGGGTGSSSSINAFIAALAAISPQPYGQLNGKDVAGTLPGETYGPDGSIIPPGYYFDQTLIAVRQAASIAMQNALGTGDLQSFLSNELAFMNANGGEPPAWMFDGQGNITITPVDILANLDHQGQVAAAAQLAAMLQPSPPVVTTPATPPAATPPAAPATPPATPPASGGSSGSGSGGGRGGATGTNPDSGSGSGSSGDGGRDVRSGSRGFATGAFVPFDLTAQLHAGEVVAPASVVNALGAAIEAGAATQTQQAAQVQTLQQQLDAANTELMKALAAGNIADANAATAHLNQLNAMAAQYASVSAVAGVNATVAGPPALPGTDSSSGFALIDADLKAVLAALKTGGGGLVTSDIASLVPAKPEDIAAAASTVAVANANAPTQGVPDGFALLHTDLLQIISIETMLMTKIGSLTGTTQKWNVPQVKSFDIGGPVDQTQLALLHEGEHVIQPGLTSMLTALANNPSAFVGGPGKLGASAAATPTVQIGQIVVQGANKDGRQIAKDIMGELKSVSTRFSPYSQ